MYGAQQCPCTCNGAGSSSGFAHGSAITGSSYGSGTSNNKSSNSNAMYVRQTSGYCMNNMIIRTPAECNAAAAKLKLSDTISSDDNQAYGVSYDPQGCYFEGGSLKHHSEMTVSYTHLTLPTILLV